MKHPITIRIDTELLEASRHHAHKENRTLTNFVETVLRQHIAKALPFAEAGPAVTVERATMPAASRSKAKQSGNGKSAHG